MPIPMELQHASQDFERFLADARDVAGLATRNQTYTMVQGVLQTFRRRLGPADAIRFAGVLPPLLRAIFVKDWPIDEPPVPFTDRASLTREVQALRRDHNFAPDTAIRDVAEALRRHVYLDDFDRVLASLPAGAEAFWSVQPSTTSGSVTDSAAAER
ncbi:DUF2267 domain-containing protein [Nitrospirillum pindoramense]|uniref:Uncharacterized protein (DUF2267 family) n=1 Tax=Nitrospirillum amazonense TaxID=28077 RepID=A0A560H276_9PROT|nr:DUF2267 domain-containing protein [Nitrospirillum amazonense]TWB40407.1 uncharacterized protein (DUF2267 family) [Nitrospirillum amazonense]